MLGTGALGAGGAGRDQAILRQRQKRDLVTGSGCRIECDELCVG